MQEEKVVCPICKLLGVKSLVYEIDWKSHFQKFGGYYDENGNYIESDIVPPSPLVSKTFWCTYGHSWIQNLILLFFHPDKVKGSLPFHFYFFWLDVGDIGKYYITNRNYKQL